MSSIQPKLGHPHSQGSVAQVLSLAPGRLPTALAHATGHSNGGEMCEGTFSLPYIADENADEDPELRVGTAQEGPLQQRAKQVFMAHKEAGSPSSSHRKPSISLQ